MQALPTTHPGVPIHLFTRHVLERHASDNTGFIQTFEHIESLAASSPKENVVSLLPHNVEKNRYKNVLACEYSNIIELHTVMGIRYRTAFIKENEIFIYLCAICKKNFFLVDYMTECV